MIVHPKDSTLNFPFIKYILESPEIILEKLYDEYFNNKQDFKYETCTLYRVYERDYFIDAVSSHFTEHIRAECKTLNKPNFVSVWKSLTPEVIKSFKSQNELRDFIYNEYNARECNYFSAGLCIRLYLGFNKKRHPIKIIDPSSGWGCRMLTAIACGDHVSEYTGYDVNKKLIEPYNKIIEKLDKDKKCSFHITPFETAHVKVEYYDLGVTSPPYFDLENYSDDESQSVNSQRKTYEEWITTFYIPYLYNLARSIKNDGRIILYVSNYRNMGKLIPLGDDTLKIYNSHPYVKYFKTGYLRQNDKDKFPRPFFIFDVSRK